MKPLLCALLTLALTACASQELQREVQPTSENAKENGLKVTSEVNQEMSDGYNLFVQINLQNKSGNWVRIDSAQLDLSNDTNSPYNIIVGKDLQTWIEAKAEEKKIQDHNDAAGILAAVVVGTTLATASGHNSLGTLGAATAIGGLGYGTAKDISRSKDRAQSAVKVPETHLYAPFTVPSMSFAKRWILINTPTGRIAKYGTLRLKTVEGETYTYNLPLFD